MSTLELALDGRTREYVAALDRLCDLASPEAENEVHELTSKLRECVELARCLRRLAHRKTPRELHAAFGAPGDFGYETPIGDALARVYRGEAQ